MLYKSYANIEGKLMARLTDFHRQQKDKPFHGVAIAKFRLLSSSTVSPLLFSPPASFWPTRH
jgi:hypothetical protein